MKNKFKLLPLLTLLITVLTSMSALALTEGDWEFQLLDNEAIITGYTGDGGDVAVPEKLFDVPVTKIECSDYNKNLNNATSVYIPGTVKIIENSFFEWYENKNLMKVTLNEGTEVLGSSVFSGCVNLSDITLPSTIKEIKSHAFSNCTALNSINFPASLENIEYSAFLMSGLTTVDLSNTKCKLGDNVFDGCENLKSIVFSEGTTEIPYGTCSGCTALKDVYIPSTVEEIVRFSFSRCTSLENIILPSSLRVIDVNAFSYCSGLTEIVVPFGTETVGSAFGDCPNLKSVYIPDSVTTLSYSLLDNSPNAIIYCSAGSKAAEVCKKHEISYLTDKSVNSQITVYYNGTRISFHEYGQDPALINDRTLVPLRAIFEALDADVVWDQATQTVTTTRNGITIKLTIGANEMYKNGQSIPVDVPAQIVNDRTMIPVRVIAEAFGAYVEWVGSGKSVLINE